MHTHRATRHPSQDRPWTGCVRPDGRDCGAAHGNIISIDRCGCGAERHTEINGRWVVRGPWHRPAYHEALRDA